MKNRDLTIIGLALVVSIGVAFGTRYILHGGSGMTSNYTKVMVASADLPVGKRLEQSSYRWQDWPTDAVQPVYITDKDKDQVDKLMGSMIKQHLSAGEPILKASLVGEKGYLSAMISNGMRALTIPLDNKSNISGKVVPEDFVDVVVASRGERDSYVARTVVRKVRVLEINGTLDKNEAEDAAHPKPQSITLEVNPKQAELLAAALREGTPVITLHNMQDDTPPPVEEVVQEAPKVEDESITIFRRNEAEKVQLKG